VGELQVPDTIGALPRSRTQLIPAAQPLSVYQGGTIADIPEPPQDNQYSQLGHALEKFAGSTGVDQVQTNIEEGKQKDRAEGAVKAQELAKDKSLQTLNKAVADGRIPEGASPAYIFAMNANFMKLRGEQSQTRMREDYYANTELRNSDDPQAFAKWSEKWKQDNETAVLKDAKGDHQYTALEIQHSNFHDRVNDGHRAIEQEHIAHRIHEREALGEQTASGLMATALERTTMPTLPNGQRNPAAYAGAIVAVGYNAVSGAATYGMDKSKVSQMMQDAIIAKAISSKDPSWLEVADHIRVGPETDANRPSLSNISRFAIAANQAQKAIATERYVEEQHAEHRAMQDVEADQLTGPGFDGKTNLQKRATYWGQQFAEKRSDFAKSQLVQAQTSIALDVKDPLKLTPKELDQRRMALEEIRKQGGSEEAFKTAIRIDAMTSHLRTTAENAHFLPMKEVELRNMVYMGGTRLPTQLRTIDRAFDDKFISAEQWNRLRTMAERENESGGKNQALLSNQAIRDLENAVGAGVKQSPEDPFGASAIHAGAAKLEFKQLVVDLAIQNPGASPIQIAALAKPYMQDIAGKYNDTLKGVMEQGDKLRVGREEVVKEALRRSQPEVIKQTEEQVKKAQAQTEQFKAFDAGKGPDPRLAATEPTIDYNPKTFDTILSPKNEIAFQAWKKKYAPNDSGADYDLRGAFKAGLKPDAKTGHWLDTFKKPNHETFSDQSRYAKHGKPGRWDGDKFIPFKQPK